MIALDPGTELYGHLLFQGGRFRRVNGYRRLESMGCDAEIARDDAADWFHRYLPTTLTLGDPGSRDAAIHAVQACIPQATVLPIGVDRLIPGTGSGAGLHLLRARQRSERDDLLIYDLEIRDETGSVRERWEGLRLRVIDRHRPGVNWPEPLLGPYLDCRHDH